MFEDRIDLGGPSEGLAVLTVGHSSHLWDHFVGLLLANGVDVVVDVRSTPASRYAPIYNGVALRTALPEAGIRYGHMGRELGGRPADPVCYTPDGRVDYGRVAARSEFRRAIDRLIDGAARFRVALLCAEEDPTCCHRRLLVGRALAARGVAIWHIRGDGRLQAEAELPSPGRRRPYAGQLALFATEERWTSTRSVSRGARQSRFSAI